jgi:hypothetical protein
MPLQANSFLESQIDFRQADNIHPRPIDVQSSPGFRRIGIRPDPKELLINAETGQVGLSDKIIAERDYTEPLRGSRSDLEDKMKIEIVHCPT